ncbi:MAG: peptide chain release factor 2 [Proteobacteria bacterium]|nr:MAG: peptide chain release factor 2 [Pseudomonadota bacterium]
MKRLEELKALSNDSTLWNDSNRAKVVMKEKSECEALVDSFISLERLLADAQAALDLARESGDAEFLGEAHRTLVKLEKELSSQEFLCKMCGEFDKEPAILEINAGSGGTEAQDWAEMLLRLYMRWAERKGFALEELDYQPGEGAGITRAALSVKGPFAFGHLRSERGVHRLVRISPFDSNARRHTSFASVAVSPDIESEVEVQVEEKDLRVDTYRSSGAGGQHVNKTDSAVRLTHIPTGIVVACQNERSQHKNRERAMKILKAKLYELQRREQEDKIKAAQGERKKIDFGSQIRSYVMQPYQLVKDLRTDFETSDVNGVLDGSIDQFIESYLLSEHNIE